MHTDVMRCDCCPNESAHDLIPAKVFLPDFSKLAVGSALLPCLNIPRNLWVGGCFLSSHLYGNSVSASPKLAESRHSFEPGEWLNASCPAIDLYGNSILLKPACRWVVLFWPALRKKHLNIHPNLCMYAWMLLLVQSCFINMEHILLKHVV